MTAKNKGETNLREIKRRSKYTNQRAIHRLWLEKRFAKKEDERNALDDQEKMRGVG